MTQYSVKHDRRSKHRQRDHSCGFFKRGTTDRRDSSVEMVAKASIAAVLPAKGATGKGFEEGPGEQHPLVFDQETPAG
jgi:hypothetical protein